MHDVRHVVLINGVSPLHNVAPPKYFRHLSEFEQGRQSPRHRRASIAGRGGQLQQAFFVQQQNSHSVAAQKLLAILKNLLENRRRIDD
ncbi:MAG: hypothetical protein ABIX46_14160 [Burkholderiaceae bacterium]